MELLVLGALYEPKPRDFHLFFFHNLSRYDAHHIIKHLKLNNGEKLSAIAKTDETYISFSLDVPVERFKSKSAQHIVLYHSLRSLDSFQFMSQSIDSLAKTNDKGDFKLLKAGFPIIGEAIFEKKTRKGFLQYNFNDTFEKFNEPFPPHGPLWYNSLMKSVDITEEQHTVALGAFNNFNRRNLGDYHDVSLRTDVLILGDIFRKFREVYMQVYNLEPALLVGSQSELGCNAHYYWSKTRTVTRHRPASISRERNSGWIKWAESPSPL